MLWEMGDCKQTVELPNLTESNGRGKYNETAVDKEEKDNAADEKDKVADDKNKLTPDGGWGWVVVTGAFCIHAMTDGCSYSFGVLFTSLIEYFGSSRSDTAWIGSLFNAVPLLGGPIASTVTNKIGFRKSAILGGTIICVGLILSSVSTSITALYITYGIIAGFGVSFPYLVSAAVIPTYFNHKMALAVGISECGAGAGTFIFTPVMRYLISVYGWRGAVFILAGIMSNIVVCGALFRENRSKKEKTFPDAIAQQSSKEGDDPVSCCQHFNASILRISVLSNWKFKIFCFTNFILFFWYDVPYIFLVDRAEELGETKERASYLVTVIGVTHMIANIGYGYLGDRKCINTPFLYCVSICCCGFAVLLFPYFTQFTTTVVLAGLFGIFSAAAEALVPSIIVNIFCVSKLTDAYGILMFLQGVANLFGPPVAGWLFDISGTYDKTFLSAGWCIVIAGILFHVVPVYWYVKGKLAKKKQEHCTA